MEDERITELYFARDESAIAESRSKFGAYCAKIAGNILGSPEDVDECLNDTWLRAWNAIPPARPQRLKIYLGKIVRNIAIDRYRRDHTGKHGGGQTELCLEELSECIGKGSDIAEELELKDLMNSFLRELPDESREIFMMRYWYLMPLEKIAQMKGLSEAAVKMRLMRTRRSLRDYLDKDGKVK